jgi:hypothetical protein
MIRLSEYRVSRGIRLDGGMNGIHMILLGVTLMGVTLQIHLSDALPVPVPVPPLNNNIRYGGPSMAITNRLLIDAKRRALLTSRPSSPVPVPVPAATAPLSVTNDKAIETIVPQHPLVEVVEEESLVVKAAQVSGGDPLGASLIPPTAVVGTSLIAIKENGHIKNKNMKMNKMKKARPSAINNKIGLSSVQTVPPSPTNGDADAAPTNTHQQAKKSQSKNSKSSIKKMKGKKNGDMNKKGHIWRRLSATPINA